MKQSDQIKNSRQQTIQNQSDNQSKINSYYNTKSSFGIRQSSCNYPSNSNFTKKQDFQQIKVKVKQQNNIFGNQTHKAIHHLNTQTDLKIIGAEKINNITSLRQVTNFTDILRNEDLQIKNEKFNKMDDQKLKIKQKFSNEQQEFLTKQNVGELQGIEKRQEKTEKKEDLSNSFQIDINENKTNTINNTLQKKLQNPKPSQKSKKQDQNQIPKDQKLLSEKINHAHQNQLIKQKIFDLEITNSIKLKGDFQNNQEIDKFLKKQINSKLPASEASLSINREKFSSSINYMIDNNNQDLNIKKSQDEVENGLPTRNVNQQFQSKDKLLKSQVSKTRSKIDEIQEINDRKLQNLDIKSNENLENEGQNNIKAFKTPYVANKKSTNQVDQLNVNYNKLYENSSKSNYLKSENNHQKLPDIFKNNFQIQSKSEQKLNAIILNNNQVELSSKKHLKSYDLLAVEAQRNIDVSSAIKSNEQLIQDLKQNNMSRGENLNFEFQKFNRLQDAKSENGANLSPSRQLTSDQIQLKTKLKYNELLKMNADIKKKNIQFLNDKLGKMNREILQADSNSVCYQNEQSNDTQNSINFKMINDEEDINQIQNNSYDSLLPNKNINGSFETYSNKVLPQSVSLNIYSQKFVNLEKINKTKRNLPTTVENQSYSSLEQQIKNYDLKQKQDELVSNQMMNHGMVQNNSTISLNYKDQKNQETLTDIQQKKQKEKKLNDESRHGPGTANTHGGYMRQNYKQKQQLENNLQDFNVNFKDSSLQCKSEIVKMNFEQNSSAVNQNFQQISYLDQMPVYNINSDFDRSFEIMDPMNFHNSEFHYPNQQQKNNFYRQNQEINNDMKSHQIGQHDNNLINFMHYQNKGAIGEGVIADNMSSIPSIHSIPVIRNQKSQATYRHGHQKISEVLNKYYHNNYGNSSLQQINNSGFSDTSKSEVYRNFLKIQQSQASAPLLAGQLNQEIYSQMNDHQINTTQISQLSHDSEMVGMMDLQNFQRHPGTKHEVYRNKKKHFDGKDGAFSGDDRHPFNGPKLHLFRKGQSKSSQAKLRKIKRSQQNVKLNEINPVAGFSQIPGNQITQNQNKNEQDIYNDINYKQKFDNDLNNSVENGSSIKNQNNQNQLSKNGHINISEILNGKIKLQPPLQYQGQNKIYTDLQSRNSFRSKKSNDLEGDSQFFQEQYKEQNLNNEDNISYNKILNNQSLEIKKKNINLNQQIAYDSDSQNCRSQLTTICQNPGIQQESIKQYENQQIVVGRETLLPLHVFANKRQSQQTNDTKQNILINNQFQDLNQIDFDEILKQQSQERKSVEDERQNELNTSQKTISNKNISVKPLKNTNQQGSNFQHPKVGKNSKHPQVFRNNINHINSQKSKKSNAKIENENSLNLKTQMINLTFNNNFPIELHHSKSHQNLLKEQQINNQQMSPGFKFLSSDQHSFKDLKYQNNEQNMSKLSDIKKDEQQNKMLGNEIIEKKQQKIQQLKDQNTIFATTFEAFNQKQLEKQQIENEQNYRAFVQTFSEQTEKIEVQKQCFNVQKYSDDKNEIVAASEDQVQIKVRFNENFDYQNSEIDKNQFKRLAVSSKTELKKSLTEEQIQYKREQVHQNQSMNTFDYQSNDQILKNNINHNQDTILISNQVIGINSINSVMSLAMPIQKQNHKQIKVDAQSDLKENEKIKLETEKMRQTHHSEMEVNRIETSSEINGMNLNNTQKSHSIAQTPCFAETPNTTDQFKGYKIDITD